MIHRVQVRGVRGADQRDRGAQPGHERAPVPAQLGQSLDRIQLRHGNRHIYRLELHMITIGFHNH